MKVAIIKYNAGNIMSVEYALQRLGLNPVVSSNPEVIKGADKVIFPGVGEASTTMNFLKRARIDQVIKDLKQPVLGICLGLQLMCSHSEEGNTDCIGVFPEKVKRFSFPDGSGPALKVPHMGWNSLQDVKEGIFDSFLEGQFVYFVHSFYAEPGIETAATSHHGIEFSAALQKDNFYATQFHPEKSGKVGAKILENFIRL
ncbi:MAG: imidazole glycerol phosphate synthase subunit HisH [Bacteroidota bacterium]